MDIHRCRFVAYPPSTINALAFSHSAVSGKQNASNVRLAIGRANGDIEIWNPLKGAWLQEIVLKGGKDRSVDGLVWIQDPEEEDATGKIILGKLRLFSIGYTTTVTEWDLENGQPLRQSSGNHGEIWCLAAQPSLSETTAQTKGASSLQQWQGQKLATGCIDGAVVMYSTADQDLKLERVLVRPSAKKAKVISITFQDRNTVVAGCTDSTIRIYDIRNASIVRSISLGSGLSGGPRETIVWAVKCLRNGNIVSGDSMGEVRIWDGKTYTLMQRIKSHQQDVLSLATNSAGTTILSGGMDRRTVVYKQTEGPRSRWAKVSHQRLHSHDVKTMAAYEGHGMSIIASGGPDASPMIVPLRRFGIEHQRMLPRLPQDPPIQSSPSKRLVMSWWDREVHIWNIFESKPNLENADSEDEEQSKIRSRKLVAKVLIKGEANITSASISSDGSLLAVSTQAKIKVFELKPHLTSAGDLLRVSKIRAPRSISSNGAKLLQFSPDGHWLGIVKTDNRTIAIRIHARAGQSSTSLALLPRISKLERIDRKAEKHLLTGGLGAYNRTITRIAFSSDSRILAVSDLAGYVDTWLLEGSENLVQADEAIEETSEADDASSTSSTEEYESDMEDKKATVVLGQRWIRNPSASLLPNVSSAPIVLSFRPARVEAPTSNGVIPHATRNNPNPHSHDLPNSEDRLLIVTATTKIYEFEVLKGRLTEWSRTNPTANFPLEFQNLKDQAMGCLWDIEEEKERLWLYGSNWMWMFDLSRDFPNLTEKAVTNGQAHKLTNGHKETPLTTNGPQISLKRKRGRGTGAGNAIPDSKLNTGISRKIQLFSENSISQTKNLDARQDPLGMELDESEDENGGESEDMTLERGNYKSVVEDHDDDAGPPRWWHTYKYRPIVGVVPLMGNGQRGIEVALIERPIWESDLPPRYYGQEWEKPDV